MIKRTLFPRKVSTTLWLSTLAIKFLLLQKVVDGRIRKKAWELLLGKGKKNINFVSAIKYTVEG